MDIPSLGLMLLIGLFFWGSWPLVAQMSDITDPFVRGFLVNVVTTIGFLPFVVGKISFASFSSSGVWVLLLAGVFNLGGHMLFPKLQIATGSQISLYGAIIPGLVVIASAIGGPFFYGDAVTLPKVCFTMLIVVGIVGLAIVSWK